MGQAMQVTDDFNEVLQQYENIIYHLINKFGIWDTEREFYQEGVIALWNAMRTYDVKRGKFSSYAYFMVEKTLLSLIRTKTNRATKEKNYLNQVSTDLQQVTTTIEDDNRIDPYLLDHIRKVLTDNQMKWFTLYILEDLSVKEIASREKVSATAVKNWGRLAKKKLQLIVLM
ncbi:sigma-70 family RNA polymerase sigma factor [Aquibacillus kalidii]|uniref:sigma-70 family RNA polymerase sigma factor n=1 Tax=Aquibacillus kalidii TaxID=2762597 RepID=UPI00164696F7|nr:sigma-70 family RNA polymerase sigma factor [Aquibacillus kalidii]